MSPATAKRFVLGLTAAAALIGAPLSRAVAATQTTTFTVTAVVQTTCSITANNLNFGNYTGVVLPNTTTLTAECSTGTPYNIGLDAGASPGATVTTRKMSGPSADLLNYGLFQDAAHTVNWGNTVGTDTESSTGTGAAQTFTVYGQIPAGQFDTAGQYQDTITVTLTF